MSKTSQVRSTYYAVIQVGVAMDAAIQSVSSGEGFCGKKLDLGNDELAWLHCNDGGAWFYKTTFDSLR